MVTSIKKEKSMLKSIVLPSPLGSFSPSFSEAEEESPISPKILQTVNVKRKGFLRRRFCLSIESKN